MDVLALTAFNAFWASLPGPSQVTLLAQLGVQSPAAFAATLGQVTPAAAQSLMVKQPSIFPLLPQACRADHDVQLAAVSASGQFLQHCQNLSHDIVLAAVRGDGFALSSVIGTVFANDFAIIMAALSSNPAALACYGNDVPTTFVDASTPPTSHVAGVRYRGPAACMQHGGEKKDVCEMELLRRFLEEVAERCRALGEKTPPSPGRRSLRTPTGRC